MTAAVTSHTDYWLPAFAHAHSLHSHNHSLSHPTLAPLPLRLPPSPSSLTPGEPRRPAPPLSSQCNPSPPISLVPLLVFVFPALPSLSLTPRSSAAPPSLLSLSLPPFLVSLSPSRQAATVAVDLPSVSARPSPSSSPALKSHLSTFAALRLRCRVIPNDGSSFSSGAAPRLPIFPGSDLPSRSSNTASPSRCASPCLPLLRRHSPLLLWLADAPLLLLLRQRHLELS